MSCGETLGPGGRPSAALLEVLVESAPVALLVSGPDGRICLVNRECEALFGYARDELIGQGIEILVPKESRERHAARREGYVHDPRARRMGIGRELFGCRRDGSLVPIEIALKPIESDRGRLVLAVIADISERKRLEADVRAANEALEQRVRERTAQLEAAGIERERLLADLREQRAALERLSREDPLTGLSNRRDFNQRLETEIQRAQRMQAPLAVAMLDLDRFKNVNDRYGHTIGDAVLQAAAHLIRAECRAIDSVGRYGGEEFALALPGTELSAATVVCERIRIAFTLFDWSRVAPGLALTVSAGVAHWTPGLDLTAVLARADVNLYEAKRRGRDRVVGTET